MTFLFDIIYEWREKRAKEKKNVWKAHFERNVLKTKCDTMMLSFLQLLQRILSLNVTLISLLKIFFSRGTHTHSTNEYQLKSSSDLMILSI